MFGPINEPAQGVVYGVVAAIVGYAMYRVWHRRAKERGLDFTKPRDAFKKTGAIQSYAALNALAGGGIAMLAQRLGHVVGVVLLAGLLAINYKLYQRMTKVTSLSDYQPDNPKPPSTPTV